MISMFSQMSQEPELSEENIGWIVKMMRNHIVDALNEGLISQDQVTFEYVSNLPEIIADFVEIEERLKVSSSQAWQIYCEHYYDYFH